MKKNLLLLAALTATASMSAGTVTAEPLPVKHLTPTHEHTMISDQILIDATATPHMAPAKAEDEGELVSFTFQVCDDPYSAIGINGGKKGDKVAIATEFPAEALESFAGNQINAISFYTGTNKLTSTNKITNATISLTHDLQGEPIMSKDITLPSSSYTQVWGEFDTPYTIETGEPLFMCVTFTLASSSDYPIVIDYTGHDSYDGGYVGFPSADGGVIWDNIAEYYGFVWMACDISGYTLPVNQAGPFFYNGTAAAYENANFNLDFALYNYATNDITSIDIEYQVGDLDPVALEMRFNGGLSYHKAALIPLTNLSYPTASPDPINVRLTINNVNGQPNLYENNSASTLVQIVPPGKGYTRNIVVEEFTGTWCGWCPRGIVAMEKIREQFPDGSIIPVCAHAGDEMEEESFIPLLSLNSSYPGALVNRIERIDPAYATIISYANKIKAIPAIGVIDLSADLDVDTKELKLSTDSEFIFDMTNADERFSIAFVVTEDNVGPYNQTNNYANNSNGVMGGWEKLGSSVPTMYNDVGRILDNFGGLEGSVPAQVTAGQTYHYEHAIQLSDELATNYEQLNVVAYLINHINGSIENAKMIKAGKIGTVGIESVSVDNSDAPVEYFNLQGIRVENPANGLYIRRQGKQAEKVFIK